MGSSSSAFPYVLLTSSTVGLRIAFRSVNRSGVAYTVRGRGVCVLVTTYSLITLCLCPDYGAITPGREG